MRTPSFLLYIVGLTDSTFPKAREPTVTLAENNNLCHNKIIVRYPTPPKKRTRMKTIGLTGGIGSGKSTVSRLLAELGAFVIDADKVGHEIYLPGKEAWQQVTTAFGRDILAEDQTIDRKKLG